MAESTWMQASCEDKTELAQVYSLPLLPVDPFPTPVSCMNDEANAPRDYRRLLILILAVVLLWLSGWVSWKYGEGGSAKLFAAASGRVGLVMAALWLAWPSLRRPAQWLPPGFAAIGVVLLAVLAAQPRLIMVALPALGFLLVLGTIVRSLKR